MSVLPSWTGFGLADDIMARSAIVEVEETFVVRQLLPGTESEGLAAAMHGLFDSVPVEFAVTFRVIALALLPEARTAALLHVTVPEEFAQLQPVPDALT